VGGASACNIYWIAEGAIELGASNNVSGMFISNSGAIAVGNKSIVNGSLFTNGGSINIDASEIYASTSCETNYGSLRNFAIFTKTGGLTNVGGSKIIGDIGYISGSMTGFENANIEGNIYITPGPSSASANFSIYENGVIVPFSTRNRVSTYTQGEITLQGIVTLGKNEHVEIKWNTDFGTIKLQNRIFTITSVR
jgi:hypothetical protein